MFKKLYFNLAIRCLIAFVLILIILSSFSILGSYLFYYKNMNDSLISVAESDFKISFTFIMNENKEDASKSVEALLSNYSGNLKINENRNIYVLRSSDLKIITPSDKANLQFTNNENISLASEGKPGNKISFLNEDLGCAYPLDTGKNQYVLYLTDNKAEIRAEMFYILKLFGFSLIPVILLSLLFAYILARRINKPIEKITKRAEGFEKGELTESIDELRFSEFEDLLRAVNHMGYVMASSISKMNGDKNRVEVILEHINNGIMTFDNYQNLIQINSAAKRILQIDDEEIKFEKFFNNLDIDIKMGDFSYLDKSKIIEKEIKKGDQRIKIWFIPFKIDSERNSGIVCVLEDITEQFNVMQTMRKFVADVSHELKTPISVISLNVESVLNYYIDDKKMISQLLKIAIQEVGKMTELIRNLLDISKYETKAFETQKEPFSIDDMLNSLVEIFSLEAESKDLSLTYHRMTDIPYFEGNRSDIERAVRNIISNSIKYTSKGDKIRIFAGKLKNEIYIKIEDTGWGIPANKMNRLFERFYRVEDEARSRDKGGTGLGLSIAKEIIENHSGKIKIESEYTKYTRVTITLPVSIIPPKKNDNN